MRPVRVLHPITRLIVGGAQENTLFTAALLDPDRYQAEVLCGPQTGSEGSLIQEAGERGVRLTVLPDLLRQVSPRHDLIALLKMARFMRAGRFDIVHTHSSKAGILGRIAARLAGVPAVVHTIHGWSFHDHMSPTVRRAYILLERLAASFTDRLIVVAGRDIEKGLREGIGRPEQYCRIRSAIPLDEFDPDRVDREAARRSLGLPPGAPVLGSVGRFSPQKDPLSWVQVAALVARRLPECRFLLVGDGPLRPQVEAMLEEYGLRERTVLTGLRRDVPALLSAMDVFLLTSLWEGLPRVLPQAMAIGLPVVARRVDGSAEAVMDGETGYLCDPGDLDGMAQRCVELLQDPDLRRAMGQRGRIQVLKAFDLKQMIAQIEALYEELVLKKNMV